MAFAASYVLNLAAEIWEGEPASIGWQQYPWETAAAAAALLLQAAFIFVLLIRT
jgi:hypothetical protein